MESFARFAGRVRPLALGLSLTLLAACGGEPAAGPAAPPPEAPEASGEGLGLGPARTIPVLRARVRAAAGGTFGDPARLVSVRVPPGALSADATLVVSIDLRRVRPGPAHRLASLPLEVRLLGGPRLALSQPMTLELRAFPPPVHPEVGELARAEGSAWVRLASSFTRPSTGTIVSTTSALSGTYAALPRRLRAEGGPAAARGFDVFMNETFGNERFFGGALGLHEVLNAVDPVTAVGLGAQVDVAKVPGEVVAVLTGTDHAAKAAALADPATTRALVKAGAVVGVVGVYGDPASDRMTSAGITCALCHQKVKPLPFELAPGVATLLPIGPLAVDGEPNAAMDAGKILSFTPGAAALGVGPLLAGWGPNQFDVRALNAFEDGAVNPTDTPPLWNFVDLDAQGYLYGWDGLFAGPDALASQAEAVYDVVMHANGAFALDDGNLPPALRIAPPARIVDALVADGLAEPGNDLDTGKLLDLQAFMRSLVSPAPGPFDEARAEAGWRLFNGKGACASCHSTADLAGTIAPEDLPAITAAPLAGDLAGGIKVPALRGVARSAPYFHDGSAATLPAAVERVTAVVSSVTGAAFTADEKAALVEYLKSL